MEHMTIELLLQNGFIEIDEFTYAFEYNGRYFYKAIVVHGWVAKFSCHPFDNFEIPMKLSGNDLVNAMRSLLGEDRQGTINDTKP